MAGSFRRQNESVRILRVGFSDCPAKTYTDASGRVLEGRSVLNHCQIVGEVAAEIIRRLPIAVRQKLFSDNDALVAALHDVGKVSPCFFEKIRRACEPGSHSLPILKNINPDLERQWGGHAGVSQVSVRAMLAPEHVPEILGQHHGFSPSVAARRANDEIFGGETWQKEREDLVAELKVRLGLDWPTVSSVPQARLLAGLTSVFPTPVGVFPEATAARAEVQRLTDNFGAA